MPRNVSAELRSAVNAPYTDEVFLVLLKVSAHPEEVNGFDPFHLVNNTEDVVSNGQAYTAFPFTVKLPNDDGDTITHAQLAIDNTDRRIVREIRSLRHPPHIELSLVLASNPDYIEAGPFPFLLRDVQYTASEVSGTLMHEDGDFDNVPADAITPTHFPGYF